jgi:putative MATE family efflux protein
MSFSAKLTSFFRLLKLAVKGGEENFTKGSIDRAIFLLSVPMVLEMSMEGIFAVVDMIYISRLHSNEAVATVGYTESLLAVVYSLAMGLSMGATAMVSRRVGEQNIPAAKVAAVQALFIGVFISILITVVGYLYSEDLLRIMGGSEVLIANNVGYTRWMLMGNLSVVMLFLINGIFRGAGEASIAFRSLVISNILNIILCPIFIFGFGPVPAYGIEGAAIATTMGRGLGVVYQIYHLVGGKGLMRLHFEHLLVKWRIIGSLFKISAGGTGQFLIGSASWIFLYRIMSEFGSDAQAGYVFAIRIIIFAIMPAWGMANAAATLVGQNLGAGKPERAEKSVWRAAFLNMIFMGSIAILSFVFARPLIGFFTVDPVALKNGIECLQIVTLGYIFYGYGMVVNQAFNGAGDTRTPIIISFFGFWVFQIPLAYIIATRMNVGPVGVYSAIALAESLMAIIAIIVFRRGRWKHVKI